MKPNHLILSYQNDRMPKGAAKKAAVTIDGADSKGKANDKEVCGRTRFAWSWTTCHASTAAMVTPTFCAT